MKLEVTLDLVNGILQYLGTKPYSEVYQLVIAINGECQPQIPAPEPEADPSVTDPAVITDVVPTPVQ